MKHLDGFTTTTAVSAVALVIAVVLAACSSSSTQGPGEVALSNLEAGTARDSSAPTDGIATLEAQGRFCSATAQAIFQACESGVRQAQLLARSSCINIGDDEARARCLADAADAQQEGAKGCEEQRAGRLTTCESLGEGRYDPRFVASAFDEDFARLTKPNPYFPLRIGGRWDYRSATELDTVEIVKETKLIEGVRCIVSKDQVFTDGELTEATDDWFAQAKEGSVWYCGEQVKEFETFDGDIPRLPELVSIEGSFKAGRAGAKPGIIFQATPKKGQVYVEEFSPGNAEDLTEILATSYAFGEDADLDRSVPEALARLLCADHDCVVTKNISQLEPGVVEFKYYARGIGVFLETNLDTDEVSQLIACNVDPRCASLPKT